MAELNTTVATAAPARPQQGVPADAEARAKLRAVARSYAEAHELVPPLTIEELQHHATAAMGEAAASSSWHDFMTVMISNEVWRPTVGTVPFERRILLLPQCLRHRQRCRAALDEFGLLCEQCGSCAIGRLQQSAESLGYIVLVAEGTTVVTKLIEQGKVDAVVGVSCLSVLERAFPHMSAGAVPGLAIPLLRDGCEDTVVDEDWVQEAIRHHTDGRWRTRVDPEALRHEVRGWFGLDELQRTLETGDSSTEQMAISWLAQAGKRWRPLLAVCAYRALDGTGGPTPDAVRRLAVAVECFHKASLVHDDIEDEDNFRYGKPTLHRQHGVPLALNVGDFLLGEGYRLIAGCGTAPEQSQRLLSVAAEGHRMLCLGQGEELQWMRNPRPLSPSAVRRIFRHKTSPAFEVALRLGALAAGAGHEVCEALRAFSASLGVAYQIQDDLHDFFGLRGDGDMAARRLSVLLAMAYAAADGPRQRQIEAAWCQGDESQRRDVAEVIEELGVTTKARQLLEHHKHEALRALSPLRHSELKNLLHRVARRILGGT